MEPNAATLPCWIRFVCCTLGGEDEVPAPEENANARTYPSDYNGRPQDVLTE